MPSIEITTKVLVNKQLKRRSHKQEIHMFCKMLDNSSRQHKQIMFTYGILSIDAYKVQIHTKKLEIKKIFENYL
jgi:hypothetical protein